MMEFKLQEPTIKPFEANDRQVLATYKAKPVSQSAKELCDRKGGPPGALVACLPDVVDTGAAKEYALRIIRSLIEKETDEPYVIT